MTLTRKDQIDSLKYLSDFHIDRVASRHAIEWRITFGTWASLIAVALRVDSLPNKVLSVALPVFWIIFSIFIHRIASKNMSECSRAYVYRDWIENMLAKGIALKNAKPDSFDTSSGDRYSISWKNALKTSTLWIQILVTGSLCLFVYSISLNNESAKLKQIGYEKTIVAISFDSVMKNVAKLNFNDSKK